MADLTELRRRFDDEIEDVIASGDRTASRFRITGTDSGGFMGMPATNKAVAVTGMDFMRWTGDKVAEHWGEMDMMGLLQQLGLVPS